MKRFVGNNAAAGGVNTPFTRSSDTPVHSSVCMTIFSVGRVAKNDGRLRCFSPQSGADIEGSLPQLLRDV
jgi:hypothetical protein